MEQDFKNRAASRKFILMAVILCSATFMLITPAILSLLGVELVPMLAGGEYVSLILGSFAIYSGANVAQKKLGSNNINKELHNKDSL